MATPGKIMEQSKSLYEKKNQDYGDSWRLTGEIVATILNQQGEKTLEIPAEPEYISAFALYVRRLDKVVRSFNGTFISGDLEVDESVEETITDQVPYAAMHAALAQEMTTVTLTTDEGEESSDLPDDDVPQGWVRCPECGEIAADKVEMTSPDTPDCEWYCKCGNVWWADT